MESGRRHISPGVQEGGRPIKSIEEDEPSGAGAANQADTEIGPEDKRVGEERRAREKEQHVHEKEPREIMETY